MYGVAADSRANSLTVSVASADRANGVEPPSYVGAGGLGRSPYRSRPGGAPASRAASSATSAAAFPPARKVRCCSA